VALDGTRTFSVQLRDALIPDAFVLADPSDAFIARIRAGFVLLQAGMGIGLIRGCIALMNQVKGPLTNTSTFSRSSSLTSLRGSKPPYLGSPQRRSTPTRPIGEP